jgi:DNA-binding response OmpR family regulator
MSTYRILLVEDTAAQGALIKRWLEVGIACEVTLANDAASGVVLARKTEFDLVLCDIELPFGSGFDVARWSKAEVPGRPVVLMTATARFDYAVSGLRAHVDEFLVKPLERRAVCELVVALIVKREAAREARLQRRLACTP